MTAHPKALPASLPPARRAALALAAALLAAPALAQNLTVTPAQQATAQQVAQAGVPLSELAPNAPDSYTVKSGDTLWAISQLYLTSPWRWPELWGMNLDQVRNPHRIYPGQQLVLEKQDGRATLRVAQGRLDTPPSDVIRVSPRARSEGIPDPSIPTLRPSLIEPFLAEPLIVGQGVLEAAPRIVAAPENRVLITRGDRVYALGTAAPLALKDEQRIEDWRIFRQAVPLRDPFTRAVLGYEAQYLGKAELVRSQGSEAVPGNEKPVTLAATLDVVSARSEMQVGDRLLPDPGRQLVSYVPRAPQVPLENAGVVSVYGEAVRLAGQNQVVVINKGTADGMEPGHILAILRSGTTVTDRSQPGQVGQVKLPNERNGLMMVFRPFERVSYALVLNTEDGVKVGDRVISPR